MIKNNFPNVGPGKRKFTVLFAVFFISLISFSRGETKDNRIIGEFEKIDPFAGKALDFLDADYAELRRQAGQFAGEKKYVEAAQCYLALLKFNLNDATSIYNLACCYGRLRKADLAVKSLGMAVRAGFRDFVLLKKDPDFIPIRDSPEFVNLLERVAVWRNNLGETLYVKTGKMSELLVKAPKKIDPARQYRLLVGLHGNGDSAENMLARMFTALNSEPLILAAPQGAYANFPLLRGQHFSWEIQTRKRELWKTADPLAIENLYEVVQVLKGKYPVAEVYILGFSQGATYAFLTGFKYPELVAGIISIGGLFPETDTEFSILKEAEIANGKKFRVFIAQGSKDPLIPVGFAARTSEKLKKYGYEVEYQEYEGGHEITPDLLNMIVSWMTKK